MHTVRMPGSDVLHLVSAKLDVDERFGNERHLVGDAKTLCDKRASEWLADNRGELCPKCGQAQDIAVAKRAAAPKTEARADEPTRHEALAS